jgi:hypothetical protein
LSKEAVRETPVHQGNDFKGDVVEFAIEQGQATLMHALCTVPHCAQRHGGSLLGRWNLGGLLHCLSNPEGILSRIQT